MASAASGLSARRYTLSGGRSTLFRYTLSAFIRQARLAACRRLAQCVSLSGNPCLQPCPVRATRQAILIVRQPVRQPLLSLDAFPVPSSSISGSEAAFSDERGSVGLLLKNARDKSRTDRIDRINGKRGRLVGPRTRIRWFYPNKQGAESVQ
ncbi:hypothetical protein BHE74_00000255 [Ensete ventricosum]|nr:hypothetical protein GW17_00049037 [Ensete ventricosum]RWW90699.1 hypothetical protein BHE74_00000255 [Ensete ventricosum]RZS07734.1 hypothetical protein BHM03_00038616 [Ensete ventricosum]